VPLPIALSLHLVKRNGGLVLRKVGSTEETLPKPAKPRVLLLVPLDNEAWTLFVA
jgi:hypothetical protein